MNGKRLLIAAVTAQASENEQKHILKGIIGQAHQLDMNVAVISNIYNTSQYNKEITLENSIYDLINSTEIDGIIFTEESFLDTELKKRILKKITQKNVPVIVVGNERYGFETINTNSKDDFYDITNHLIEIHKLRNIHLLTGYEQLSTSHERIEGYRKALEDHGIPFDKNKVFFGDFWYNSGKNLADRYIKKELDMPQAVVCANDYMAYAMCDRFIEFGVKIPEDIMIMGYEYVGNRMYHSPILTTYYRNRKGLGEKAVRILYNKITGNSIDTDISLKGRLVLGNSCKCGVRTEQLNCELTQKRNEEDYNKINIVGGFEYQLTLARSLQEYLSVLMNFHYFIRNTAGIYLCLYDDIFRFGNSDKIASDNMHCYAVNDYEEVQERTNIFINKYALIPDFLKILSKPVTFYFSPMFFGEKVFGYIILIYDKPDGYDYIFKSWTRAAANALEFLCMKNDINYLIECQNVSDFYDSVTGLYNEKGFEDNVRAAVSHNDGNFIMLLLKTEIFINEFSISNQKIKIDVLYEISEALKNLAKNKCDLCAKINDNTYAFASFGNYNETHENLLIDKISTNMLHQPLYIKEFGINSFACSAVSGSVADFNYKTVMETLQNNINEQINKKSEKYSLPNYTEFTDLRNQIYLNPEKVYMLSEMCHKFCFSSGYFRAIYKEYFDISYHQDIINSKISLAKYLLNYTNLSISAIAQKCGYDDEKYFMRQFKKITKYTPNQYRSMM